MLEKLEYFKDPLFKFDVDSHSYTYINENTGLPTQMFESVSGFISQFKKPFDKNISKWVAKSRGVTQQEVLDEWEHLGNEGKRIGTIVHEWIESYYRGENPSLTGEEKVDFKINNFLDLYKSRLCKLTPILQEFRVFSKKWGIAGTLDALFELNGKYYVGDWKTNRDFKDDKHPKGRREKMLHPFNNLWSNDLNGYSVQISTYRLLLEEAGFETEGGFLVSLSETGSKIYPTLDLRPQLRAHLDKNSFSFF